MKAFFPLISFGINSPKFLSHDRIKKINQKNINPPKISCNRKFFLASLIVSCLQPCGIQELSFPTNVTKSHRFGQKFCFLFGKIDLLKAAWPSLNSTGFGSDPYSTRNYLVIIDITVASRILNQDRVPANLPAIETHFETLRST